MSDTGTVPLAQEVADLVSQVRDDITNSKHLIVSFEALQWEYEKRYPERSIELLFSQTEWLFIHKAVKKEPTSHTRARREARKLGELYHITFDEFTGEFGLENARREKFTQVLRQFYSKGASLDDIRRSCEPYSAKRRAEVKGNRGRSKDEKWITADMKSGLKSFLEDNAAQVS
jgi:hypothetical protein